MYLASDKQRCIRSSLDRLSFYAEIQSTQCGVRRAHFKGYGWMFLKVQCHEIFLATFFP